MENDVLSMFTKYTSRKVTRGFGRYKDSPARRGRTNKLHIVNTIMTHSLCLFVCLFCVYYLNTTFTVIAYKLNFKTIETKIQVYAKLEESF